MEEGISEGDSLSGTPLPYPSPLPFSPAPAEDRASVDGESEHSMRNSLDEQERMHFVLPRPAPAGSVTLPLSVPASPSTAEQALREETHNESPREGRGPAHIEERAEAGTTAQRRDRKEGRSRVQMINATEDGQAGEDTEKIDFKEKGIQPEGEKKESEQAVESKQECAAAKTSSRSDSCVRNDSSRSSAAPRDSQEDREGTRAVNGSFLNDSGLDESSVADEREVSAAGDPEFLLEHSGNVVAEAGVKKRRRGGAGDRNERAGDEDESAPRNESFNAVQQGHGNDEEYGATEKHAGVLVSEVAKQEEETTKTEGNVDVHGTEEGSQQHSTLKRPSSTTSRGGERSSTTLKETYKSLKRFPPVEEESVPPLHPPLGSPFMALNLIMRLGATHLQSATP